MEQANRDLLQLTGNHVSYLERVFVSAEQFCICNKCIIKFRKYKH